MNEDTQTLTIKNRVVVFDYGEVISRSPSDRDRADLTEVAGVAGTSERAFWSSYNGHRDDLDQGLIGIRQYWRLIAAELDIEFSESKIHELWVADFTGWLSVDTATFDVIADLFEGGTRIALLSNAGFDFASPFRFSPMARFFERMFISAEMLMLKPNADIYLEVAKELGISPSEMVFIDNKQANIDGAELLGITAHHYVGATELRAFLSTLTER